MIELRGVSWDHPRGHDPMVATAAAYCAAHPEVSIQWSTRSLQAFADFPIQRLAETYDLLVVDHPFMGFAAADGCLLALDEYLDRAVLEDQAANSVGPSHRSYFYDGHQWALATDAASQVSAYRPDLLERLGMSTPRTWDEVLTLATRQHGQDTGQVAIPLIPVDAIMSFCSICASAGEEPFQDGVQIVSRAMGRHALDVLTALRDACHPESITWNPPRTLDRMSQTDEIAYVPLLFGYSNYARPGFRPNLVRFTNVPATGDSGPRGAILGGAGLAVASRTSHREVACDYAAFVASGKVQRTLYFESGGQPGHRSAWADDAVNQAASGFFRDTLDTLDNAYLRPRYLGYMEVQERSGELIHAFLRDGGNANAVLDELDALYRGSMAQASTG